MIKQLAILAVVTTAAPAFADDAPTDAPAPTEPAPAAVETAPAPTPAPVAPAASTTASAPVVDASTTDTDNSLQLHGWVSQGGMVSTGNNYLANTKRGSFEFFDAGINVTEEIGSKIRAGIQIFAQDLGPIGNYNPIVDWAYVDYRVRPEFGVRIGHFKMPLFLNSEHLDADMSHTTVLMPQAVYDQHYRDILAAVSGVDLYGHVDLGKAGAIDYDAYGGTLFIQPRGGNYDVHNLVGSRVTWETPLPCLRASVHGLYGKFSETYDSNMLTVNFNDWKMFGGALECRTEKVTLTVEGSRWLSDETFDAATGIPAQKYDELRSYVQAEYRATDDLSAAVYLSAYMDRGTGNDWHQDQYHQYDLAASVRYDITPNLLVKVEAHSMDGYGLTESSLNTDTMTGRPGRWSMFLAKSTLTF